MCACIGAGLCKATEGNAPWKGEAREGITRIGSCPPVTTHLPSLCKLPVAHCVTAHLEKPGEGIWEGGAPPGLAQ